MKQSKLKENILMTCLNDGIVQTQALYTIYDKKAHLRKFIYTLTNEGYLRNQNRTVKYQGVKCEVSYKAVTKKGVQWLIDNCQDTYEWLRYMPNPMCDFSVKVSSSNEGTNRYLKTKTASVMLSVIGIPTNDNTSFYRHSDNETLTLREIIEQARNKEAQDKKFNETIMTDTLSEAIDFLNSHADEQEYPLSKEYKDIFYSSKDILQYFRYSKKEIAQYQFANYIGILISRSRSYIVYHTTPRGISLTSTTVDRTKQAVKWFIRDTNATPETFNYAEYGIILCRNSREFENAFKDKYNQRKGKEMGLLFTALYMLPVRNESISLLSKILSYKDRFHNKICETLLQSGNDFEENDTKLCELRYQNSEACICVDMDIGILERFAKRARDNPNEKYIGICFEWQCEYLQRILPTNVGFYIMSEDYIQKQPSKSRINTSKEANGK